MAGDVSLLLQFNSHIASTATPSHMIPGAKLQITDVGAWTASSRVATVDEESSRRDIKNLVSALARDGFTGLPMVEPGAGKVLCLVTIC